MQYLIENIWAGQSILSAWDDLYDLILVRWNKDDEWSPWNTILLTKDEAMAHLKLDHLDDVSCAYDFDLYGDEHMNASITQG